MENNPNPFLMPGLIEPGVNPRPSSSTMTVKRLSGSTGMTSRASRTPECFKTFSISSRTDSNRNVRSSNVAGSHFASETRCILKQCFSSMYLASQEKAAFMSGLLRTGGEQVDR